MVNELCFTIVSNDLCHKIKLFAVYKRVVHYLDVFVLALLFFGVIKGGKRSKFDAFTLYFF